MLARFKDSLLNFGRQIGTILTELQQKLGIHALLVHLVGLGNAFATTCQYPSDQFFTVGDRTEGEIRDERYARERFQDYAGFGPVIAK